METVRDESGVRFKQVSLYNIQFYIEPRCTSRKLRYRFRIYFSAVLCVILSNRIFITFMRMLTHGEPRLRNSNLCTLKMFF